jgi:N-sulfoglucosamine sulfohydrolase
MDDVVGCILEELKKADLVDNTIVIFLSDNGMSVPFSKSNCYMESTRTPLIIRWPGQIKKGSVDREHMVSAIDLMPTILDAVDLPLPQKMDGRSFLPLLRGESQTDRNIIFAQFNHVHGKNPYPMRSAITKRHVYCFNAWSNGKRRYWAEPMVGLTFNAMKRAAENDPAMAARVRHLEYRTIEEFYDLQKDPYCLNNLLEKNSSEKISKSNREQLAYLQEKMRDWMVDLNDPILTAFDGRKSSAALEQFMQKYTARATKEVEELKPYEEAKGYQF